MWPSTPRTSATKPSSGPPSSAGRSAATTPGSTLDVVVAGETVVAIQDAPDHVAPEWPSNDPARQQQQAHLDLYVDAGEVEAAEADVISLGARLLDDRYDVTALEWFRVYADPAGHPFCICW